MRHIKSEIEKIVYDEFGDELDAKDKIIETKDKELKTKDNEIDSLNKSKSQLKNKAQQLNELDDLNTPQAKKILESMLLL